MKLIETTFHFFSIKGFIYYQQSEEYQDKPNHWFGCRDLWVADRIPEQVKAVIYGDSSLNIPSLIETAATEDWIEDAKREREWSGKPVNDLIKIFKDLFPNDDMDFIMLEAEAFSNADPELSSYWAKLDEFFEGFSVKDILERLRIPFLVIQANPELWSLIDHEDVKWARTIMPDLSHVYLGELNHWLGFRDKREHMLLNAITPFLESLK